MIVCAQGGGPTPTLSVYPHAPPRSLGPLRGERDIVPLGDILQPKPGFRKGCLRPPVGRRNPRGRLTASQKKCPHHPGSSHGRPRQPASFSFLEVQKAPCPHLSQTCGLEGKGPGAPHSTHRPRPEASGPARGPGCRARGWAPRCHLCDSPHKQTLLLSLSLRFFFFSPLLFPSLIFNLIICVKIWR